MRSHNWIKYLTTITLALVIIACANVRPPTGGKDDRTAPQVDLYSPSNFSTQFESRQIIMEFDEWIQLNDINNQLIVSPPMDPAPKVTLKKKSIIVELSESLLENTTYSLSFGEGVEDYRASNPASELRYVFSTGDALDSLHFDGKVVDAFSGKPMEDVKVMLYDEPADSVVTKEKPLYFGITDKEGNFEIDYLKSGNFKCFALLDDNANYLLDDGESHGWTEIITPVVPDSSMDMIIRIHSPESNIQLLTDYESDSTGFVKMAFAYRGPSISVLPVDPSNAGQYSWPKSQDSAYFWMTKGEPANNLELKISDGDLVLDTIEIDWFSALPTRALPLKSNAKGKIRRDEGLNFSSSRILTQIDPSKLSFESDSTPVPFTIEIDESSTQVDLKTQLVDDQKYKLLMLPGAITSREGWTNDTLDISFSTQATDYYGNLDFSVVGLPDGKHILQFLNARDEVTYEFTMSQDTSFSISRVPPETFTLRAIQDLNDNDEWDGGDYWSDQQPEKVLHYAAKIQVRSNWDHLIEWRIIDP